MSLPVKQNIFLFSTAVDAILDRPHKLNDAELVVKPYFHFLQPAQSSASKVFNNETQDVMEKSCEDQSNVQMQTSAPLVDADPDQSSLAGRSDSCRSSSHTTMEILVDSQEQEAEEVMEDQTDGAETLSCHVAVTDPVKRALFQSSTFQQDVQKDNPDCSIQNKDDGVYIEGPEKLQLEHLKGIISDFFGNMVETHFILELEKAKFLDRKDVKEHFLQTINQSGSSSLYTVSDSTISVTSLSQSSANQTCSFLTSQVCSFSMPVAKEHEGMIYCRELSEFLQSLSFTSAKVSQQGGNIDVVTLKGVEDEKQVAITKFLSTPIERETVICMEPGMLKYIQIHCHQLLADMDQVSIFPLEAEEACGLKVSKYSFCCKPVLFICFGF